MTAVKPLAFLAAIAVATLASGLTPAHADTTVRVGKAVAGVFDFVPLDVGMAAGIFKRHGLDIKEIDFGGAAKYQQALAADAIDIGLGGGPELAFVAKGAPDLGVAVTSGAPTLLLMAGKDASLKTAADLKAKEVSVSTVGSLSAWLAREFARHQGWGPNGVQVVALGSIEARIASLETGETAASVLDVVHGTELQERGTARIVAHFRQIVPDFITHVIFAQNGFMAQHPQQLRGFLAGWFETIAFMNAHKAQTVAIAAKAMHQPANVVAIAYDETMPVFSKTGQFEPKPLAVLRQSFIEMKWLPSAPDMAKLYTERFLPASTQSGAAQVSAQASGH